MSLLQVVVLALIQGLTEFLPISSSAHLALAPWLFGWPDQGLAFDIALHFGTLLAVLLYFFKDWTQILCQGFRIPFGHDPELKRHPNLLWLIALGTLPIGILGYLFKHQAETTLRNPIIIGVMLITVGLLMEVAERVGNRHKNIDHVSLFDAIAVGMAQALAIIPGTSRSGITIVAGLFRNFDRATAARFSFLLSTPAIAAAVGKDLLEMLQAGGIPEAMRIPMGLGILVSAVTGCIVIGLLMNFLRRRTLRFFVIYRVIFGILVIALALLRPAAA
jgi:undecaprenyl-diphosphatase